MTKGERRSGLVDREVERLFRKSPPLRGELCSNPVTGSGYVGGIDPIKPQKEAARGALLAREWFFVHGPTDAPPLPINGRERGSIKYRDPMSHLVSQFCNSLDANHWDINAHPGFEAYSRGVMASPFAADIVRKDETMLKRYPPKELNYIHPGMIWRPEPV